MIKYTLEQQARNCLMLADILERVEESAYDHRVLVSEHSCGTRACALGYAFLSCLFDGLPTRAGRSFSGTDLDRAAEALGVDSSLSAVADAVFGENSYAEVFSAERNYSPRYYTRQEVIDVLQERGHRLYRKAGIV